MTEVAKWWPGNRQAGLFVLLGLVAGLFSGMFGVGGGLIIVPGLIAIAGFTPRLAAGTSLLTIVPLAAVGVVSYAAAGSISWIAAGLLALGAVIGAQLGTFLLSRINLVLLRRVFVGFILLSIVMLFVVVPSREVAMQITWGAGLALIAVGVLVGTLSGLLGIGGGAIIVPVLMVLFGASDLVAKGTSLLTMIPAAISGTVPNVIRRNVDVPAALIVGVAACLTTFLGSALAHAVSPLISNICFSLFLVFVAVRLLRG